MRSQIGWCNISNTFTVLLSADILLALSKTINDFQVVLKRISSVNIFLLYYITPGLDNFPPFARTRSSIQLKKKWEFKGGKKYLQSGIFFYLFAFMRDW